MHVMGHNEPAIHSPGNVPLKQLHKNENSIMN